MDIVKWIAGVLALMTLFYGGLVALGAWRWSLATDALKARLDSAPPSGSVPRYDAAEIAGLPAPVRRYFERVLRDGQPIIRSADISIAGRFNMSLEAPQWKPFTSRQYVVTKAPGFVWNGRIMLFPGVPVLVHDAYVAGEGILTPAVLGLFRMGQVRGGGKLAEGELMRWFAESVWYPTALLPSQGIEWRGKDSTSAQASITDGAIRLTMLFRFGDDGLVCGIRLDARAAMVGRQTLMLHWERIFGGYQRQYGMLVPFQAEVA